MMLSSSLQESSNYNIRIRCVIPPNISPSSSLTTESSNKNSMMQTTTKNYSSNNSFGFASPTPKTTCNICKRLFYSFEEILTCQLCHASYHWRCVKPETISVYGENSKFLCDQCNNGATSTTSFSSNRLANGSVKLASSDTSEAACKDNTNISAKVNTIPTKDMNVVTTIRYYDDKPSKQQQQQQQQQLTSTTIPQLNEYNEHFSSHIDGRYTDDSKTNHQYQEQQNLIESEDEKTTTEMFQATYQYTPLTEYAALRNDPTTIDTNTHACQKSLSAESDQQLTSSRYADNLNYVNRDYEAAKSNITSSPLNNSTSFTSSTVDNLPVYNRHQHFISTTNLSVNDTLSRRQQQQNNNKTSLHYSSPYLSQLRDDGSYTFPSSFHQRHQQYTDRHSNVESDSGIVMGQSNHQQVSKENNLVMDKKLADLVQKLEHQLENDTQKLSEKLETKLKGLEHMINQQTFVIQEQDQVIERLKTKITKIETERDHFRDQLDVHIQFDQNGKIQKKPNEIENKSNKNERDDNQQKSGSHSTNRKESNSSTNTTDSSKRSSKKVPAPRIDNHSQLSFNDNESVIAKLIKNDPINPDRRVSSNSNPTIVELLAASTPLVEPPAAMNRLDHMVHQSNTSNVTDPTSAYYNVSGIRHYESNPYIEENSMEQFDSTASTNHVDQNVNRIKTSHLMPNQSISSSTSSTASNSMRQTTHNVPTGNMYTLPARNSVTHRSLEALPTRTSQTDQGLRPGNKATSLEFNQKPVHPDDQNLIHFTPRQAAHPASQYQTAAKGWLRKQNRDSFFKRVENYYFVLSNRTILMHKHDYDRTAYKAIDLTGATIKSYDDPKYGAALVLTWTPPAKRVKHYHLYAPNKQDANRWFQAIETAMNNFVDNNNWRQYRMDA